MAGDLAEVPVHSRCMCAVPSCFNRIGPLRGPAHSAAMKKVSADSRAGAPALRGGHGPGDLRPPPPAVVARYTAADAGAGAAEALARHVSRQLCCGFVTLVVLNLLLAAAVAGLSWTVVIENKLWTGQATCGGSLVTETGKTTGGVLVRARTRARARPGVERCCCVCKWPRPCTEASATRRVGGSARATCGRSSGSEFRASCLRGDARGSAAAP